MTTRNTKSDPFTKISEFLLLLLCVLLVIALCALAPSKEDRNGGDTKDVSKAVATPFEESCKEELTAIYQLLAANAFTARTNMNLAAKTNHYITHPEGQHGHPPDVACEECWGNFEHFVNNMPPMPESNQAYFDTFYKKKYEKLKLERKSHE